MTKNLGMTVEQRHTCEKKAAKFENKLFDIMKNLEQKYQHSGEKSLQDGDRSKDGGAASKEGSTKLIDFSAKKGKSYLKD
jgi:hypothetical protein